MSKRKLLLADDSVTIQKVVNLTFADEGIEVLSVGDGDSAMEKIGEFSPDLVMADVNMPGLNGYQICEKIREDASLRQTPVILLVGSFEPFDEEEAKRVGADDFLTKPFQSIRQLVNKVTVLLNSGERETTAAEMTAVAPVADSFAETLEMPFPEAETKEFSRDEFDDEMIETSQVGGFSALDESSKFETKELPYPEDPARTQALTAEDVKDFAFTIDTPSTAEVVADETGEESVNEETAELSPVSEEISESSDAADEVRSPADEFEETEEFQSETPEFADESEEVEELSGDEEDPKAATEQSLTEPEVSEGIPAENEEPEESLAADQETESFAPVDEETGETTETEEIPEESLETSADSETEAVESEAPETGLQEAQTQELPLSAESGEDVPMPASASILDLEGDLLELPPIEIEDELPASNLRSEEIQASGESADVSEESEALSSVSEPEEEAHSFVGSEPAVEEEAVTEELSAREEPAEELSEAEMDAEESTAEESIAEEPGPETDLNEPVESLVESEPVIEEAPAPDVSAALSQFSPELIEAIAQKVVEKLSDKAIKEVAWEVVPQMTELIVKEMIAEEKLKE